ncbi:nuclear transport factor 2 family protein [Catenulispora yoronensis]|uniref:Nuclear transport factor 2 family protein n=1 Tax=Catenulispora yoronensis TaxID=450799 RepID=A0ABP5GJU2_9ACTN
MRTAKEIIEAHYAASAAKDLDGMVADFAAQVEWTEMAGFPYAGTYVGPESVKENVFLRLGAEWDSYDATPEQLVADEEAGVVVGLGWYTGVHGGTGRAMRARFAHFWTLADGEIVRFEQVTDSHVVREAMR